MKKRIAYRDTKTGRWVKKSTWERSKSGRYKRERVKVPERVKEPEEIEAPEEADVFEFVVSFSYDKSGRSFDVIVTARSAAEANQVAKEFLKGDKNGAKIAKAGFTGWKVQAARGQASGEEVGEAEYRSDSEEEI